MVILFHVKIQWLLGWSHVFFLTSVVNYCGAAKNYFEGSEACVFHVSTIVSWIFSEMCLAERREAPLNWLMQEAICSVWNQEAQRSCRVDYVWSTPDPGVWVVFWWQVFFLTVLMCLDDILLHLEDGLPNIGPEMHMDCVYGSLFGESLCSQHFFLGSICQEQCLSRKWIIAFLVWEKTNQILANMVITAFSFVTLS